MKAIWLIGVNFVRQQRVVLFVFLAWLLFFGILLGFAFGGDNTEEILALFRQEAAYGVIVSVFVSASAIHGERKSRRIIAVLSKGIYHWEYLAGIMVGNILIAAIYFAVMGVLNQAVMLRFGWVGSIWSPLGAAFIASILASALALAMGTFLHPMPATVLTMGILGAPLVLQSLLSVLPVAYVVQRIMDYNYAGGWTGGWNFVAIAVVETAFFFALAAAIFSRRDVTAPVE